LETEDPQFHALHNAVARRFAMRSSQENPAGLSHARRTLVVMAKAPRPGLVKTRLTQNLSVDAVTELYRCLLRDTIALARSLDAVEVAIMCPAGDVGDLANFGCEVVAQKGEGLAAALTSVFAHFAPAGRQHVVAFNSDSPHLPASVLLSAFESLEQHDVVVGPTHDGGYYLVGADAAQPTLFHNDGMGTKNALERLLERAGELKLSVAFTDSFYDIDVHSDLARLAAELRLVPAKAPRTAAWLKAWEESLAQLQLGAEQP
jgi:rSAM/selenodomain-associated transferase 1